MRDLLIPFPVWAALDTRLLAELAAPTLAGFSLETVAAWLGVPIAGRHRALADALCTARVFLGLAPRLRERGIRTVGEAEAACRRLVSALEGTIGPAGSSHHSTYRNRTGLG